MADVSKQLLDVAYSSLSVVSAFVFARVVLQIRQPRPITGNDKWVMFAYSAFIVQCVMYVILVPIDRRLMAVEGSKGSERPSYKQEKADLVARMALSAVNVVLSAVVLWSIKAGLLMLYRQLTMGVSRIYRRIWWAIAAFCGLVSSYIYTVLVRSQLM